MTDRIIPLRLGLARKLTPDQEGVLRQLADRSARLARLVRLPSPKWLISDAVDLVLKTMEQIEADFGDRDGAARLRKLVDLKVQREIDEAGGLEAWMKKIDAEIEAEGL